MTEKNTSSPPADRPLDPTTASGVAKIGAGGLFFFAASLFAGGILSAYGLVAVVAKAIIAEIGLSRLGVVWADDPEEAAPSSTKNVLRGVGMGLSASVLAALAALLLAYPAERFPLLRRKLRTVFADDAIGLATARPAADGSWRCYIPLTERTVDGEYYYPCSVWLREGGAPLGRTDEPQAEQRRKSAAFVSGHDCRREPICQRYCLHCTRQFNDAVNAERSTGA